MSFLDLVAAHPLAVAFGVVMAVASVVIVWAMIAADAEGR